ncbi:hypothetical protein CHS0354_003385 [Potamilus streckersoni]|uniref:Uncharacterized protein n=1 Tax=Potamilus streckersoni TaxID=2493646 RepID=A0AAE0W199_9BIVA|nr:hypothetical protein CHS0354_003385 [Potamilus streckersoni]
MEFMLESDEIWILDSCDQESDENISFFTTTSITKSTRDSKLHEYSWKITGLKSDKCRMPMTFGRSHLRKRPFPGIHSASKKKGLMSPGRGKHQEDHIARQEASKDGCAEKKSRKNVVRRLFANECGFDYHGGSNKLEDLMLEEDINSAPTARAHQYTRSYQNEEEESYRGPFYQAEKKIRHTETKESPGDDQNWLVISTEEEEGLICSRNFELSDDYWILISHNEDNVATHKYRLYYYHEVDKMPLCHQDDLPDSPVSTCGRNVSVTNSSYNSTSIRLAEPFTERRASSTKMPTKVISQATQMESGPRSRLPSLSFYYESEYDDWIIITGIRTRYDWLPPEISMPVLVGTVMLVFAIVSFTRIKNIVAMVMLVHEIASATKKAHGCYF